jgi:hypothetical protein
MVTGPLRLEQALLLSRSANSARLLPSPKRRSGRLRPRNAGSAHERVCSRWLVEAVRWSQRAATRWPQPPIATTRRKGAVAMPFLGLHGAALGNSVRPPSRFQGQPTKLLPTRELIPLRGGNFFAPSIRSAGD